MERHCLWCGKKLRMKYHHRERVFTGEWRAPNAGRCWKEPTTSTDGCNGKLRPVRQGEASSGETLDWEEWVYRDDPPEAAFACDRCHDVSRGERRTRFVGEPVPVYDLPGVDGCGLYCTLRCGFYHGVDANKWRLDSLDGQRHRRRFQSRQADDGVNHRAVLGVSRSATVEEVREAYHSLAKQHHPDKPGGSEERFKQINAAHEALTGTARRK